MLAELLKSEYPDAEIHREICDMSVAEEAVSLAERLKKYSLYSLVLNAGAYSIPRYKTSLGYDNVYTINYISPLILADSLRDDIASRGGKIIAVGSIAHRYSKIDRADIDFSTRKKASLVYGNSKRYLMYTLMKRAVVGAPYVIAHPGITFTGITSHYPKLIFALIKYPMKIIFMRPRTAALSILLPLFKEVGEYSWCGPAVFDIWGKPTIRRLKIRDMSEVEFADGISSKILSEIKK
jgi:NAD(P)-dependent dehydrogenase (short-subunit alcohol dehydrogenase family)